MSKSRWILRKGRAKASIHHKRGLNQEPKEPNARARQERNEPYPRPDQLGSCRNVDFTLRNEKSFEEF